jgi:hypothetical protein
LIEEWEKSDLSKEAFCRHKNLSSKSFYYWLEKLVGSGASHKSCGLRKNTPVQFYTMEQWQEIIADWKKSGLSRDIYCTKKNLARTTFYHWSKKFEDPEQALRLAQTSARRHYTLEQQKEYVDDWKKSSLSQEAYCREKGIAVATFYTWLQKFRDPNFLEEALKRGPSPVRRHYTLDEQRAYVEGWKKSNLSKEAYCRKHHLSSSTFYYWEQKFTAWQASSPISKETQKKESALSILDQFIPVTLKPASTIATPSVSPTKQKVEVVLSQGHRLSLEGSFEWEALAPLLTALLTK